MLLLLSLIKRILIKQDKQEKFQLNKRQQPNWEWTRPIPIILLTTALWSILMKTSTPDWSIKTWWSLESSVMTDSWVRADCLTLASTKGPDNTSSTRTTLPSCKMSGNIIEKLLNLKNKQSTQNKSFKKPMFYETW